MGQIELGFGAVTGERRVWTVTALLAGVRQGLEREYFDVWVEGEVSNCKQAPSRHIYFTLKDGQAQLRAVMFAAQARYVKFKLRDGLQVRVRGRISLYEARGDLQCYVEHVEPLGRGELQLAFEQLKQKLAAEGLFAPERKRALPRLPRRIGLVTSPRGAAVADMIRILRRRFPSLDILLYPVAVQGTAAAGEMVAALDYLGAQAEGTPQRVDVVIVGRGGGSLEDLWAFNEEVVARALARCPIPVISAVGHETDFTIADFVADVRAPTPSAAAELAVRPRAEFAREQAELQRRLAQGVRYRLLQRRHRLQDLARHRAFDAARQGIGRRGQRADELGQRLAAALRRLLTQRRRQMAMLAARARHRDPRAVLAIAGGQVQARRQALAAAWRGAQAQRRRRVEELAAVLGERNPLRILARGYALVYDHEGRLATDPSAIAEGE
ncbi:MAG TPA: exodeoxyribonuclease VII large subunit, partial [Terriglobales bacterium]|nr:exodeoxyribonuclease VII large subunit [Terriglobales bacterium]